MNSSKLSLDQSTTLSQIHYLHTHTHTHSPPPPFFFFQINEPQNPKHRNSQSPESFNEELDPNELKNSTEALWGYMDGAGSRPKKIK